MAFSPHLMFCPVERAIPDLHRGYRTPDPSPSPSVADVADQGQLELRLVEGDDDGAIAVGDVDKHEEEQGDRTLRQRPRSPMRPNRLQHTFRRQGSGGASVSRTPSPPSDRSQPPTETSCTQTQSDTTTERAVGGGPNSPVLRCLTNPADEEEEAEEPMQAVNSNQLNSGAGGAGNRGNNMMLQPQQPQCVFIQPAPAAVFVISPPPPPPPAPLPRPEQRGCGVGRNSNSSVSTTDELMSRCRSDTGSQGSSTDAAGLQTPTTATLPPSRGSAGHPNTCADPCKYVRKKRGCKDGAECVRCHICVWNQSDARRLHRHEHNNGGMNGYNNRTRTYPNHTAVAKGGLIKAQ